MRVSYAYLQYIVWPETLIFLGIDFVLPKRQYYYQPLKRDLRTHS